MDACRLVRGNRTTLAGILFVLAVSTFLLVLLASEADSRPPIRRAFFNVYPSAVGSRLDDLPSNSGHCGVCHYDFDGGGPRNPYGLAVQTAIPLYSTYEEAIQSIEGNDQDVDGFTSLVEITDLTHFSNTPTFPGLRDGDLHLVTNVDTLDLVGYLTPSGGTDITPPDVLVLSPNGGEDYDAGTVHTVTWTATDSSGVTGVDIALSDDGGTTFKFVARGEANDGSFDWFVPNLPGASSILRVTARDGAGNEGYDDSDGSFTIEAIPPGYVPTTLRDMHLAGTQPFEGAILDDPSTTCVLCHGEYDDAVEPYRNWEGSMMAQAARDPLFLACVTVAEQDAPSVGDLCLRCHTPGGWQEGRSVDTGGGMLTAKDRQGVQCDFCHRAVDPFYQPGVSPLEDQAVLDSLDALPVAYANGQFVNDPNPVKRGPYDDAVASHAVLYSPFHRKGGMCGTCHDVSNPVFLAGATPGDYVPNGFDAPHPDGDLRNMFPIERTYSEWSVSDYASVGVYAPEFAGDKPDGIVSTCQDCHMHDVTGAGCNQPGAPTRGDLPLHDLTGGNTFVLDILPSFFPTEVDSGALAAARARAVEMLGKAASMELASGWNGTNPTVEVTVTNETAHRLPSGYPEGRRIWIHVRAYDDAETLVYESGHWDPATGLLEEDPVPKVYHTEPGLSPGLAAALGLPAGPSFHFVLNDTVWFDNRIPPRGATNAELEAVQSPPVGYSYADSQYWDVTEYALPLTATHAEVELLYQTTSKEYVEFLRDENVTNDRGQDLYDAWVAQGRAAPIVMQSDTVSVMVPTSVASGPAATVTALAEVRPNPVREGTEIAFSLAAAGPARVAIFDVTGRRVRQIAGGVLEAGAHRVAWSGRDDGGRLVAAGLYWVRLETEEKTLTRKLLVVR